MVANQSINQSIISLFNPFGSVNTKLQGRSILHKTLNTLSTTAKQLIPIVTVSNKITKAVRSENAVFRTGKARPQPVPMNDIRGLWQQVRKETGLLDVRYETLIHDAKSYTLTEPIYTPLNTSHYETSPLKDNN